MKILACASLIAAAAVACSSSSSRGAASPDASTGDDAAADATPAIDTSLPPIDAAGIVAARPYTLHVPPGLDASKPAPLVVMFHGYSVTGAIEEAYLDMASASDAAGFLFAYGDGTVDPKGFRFWNATDACCDDYGIQVDDVQYFDAIVDDVQAGHSVDARRIFVMGHSNGGFMSHRLACDRAQRIAAIVSLAGAQWDDPTRCAPVEPVSVLEIHGDADTTIRYAGGSTANADAGIVGGTYPSAHTTVATWAQKNGCTGALADTGQTLDVDALLPGNETKVETYGGCPASIDVQLWTIQGGIHEPNLNRPAFGQMVWGFMSAHARP